MSSFILVFTIILLNTIGAVVMLIYNLARKKGDIAYVHFFVILLIPLVGAVYLFCANLFYRISLRDRQLTYEGISFDASRHIKKQKGDFMEEVNILPLEEAFKVSDKKDRRFALLSTLKKESTKNIATILLGLNNEDSETRHYAASYVLATSTDYLNLLNRLREEYRTADDQSEAAREYLAGLKSFLQSDILDAVDQVKYIRIYTDVLSWMFKYFRDEVLLEDYIYQIELLLECDDYENAKIWADRAMHSYPDEDAPFYVLMKMHYQLGDYDSFLVLLRQIMQSSINISGDTLQKIRFFNVPNPTL